MKDLEGKISADEKSKAQAACDELKKAIESNDSAQMKDKTDKLTAVFNELAQKLYAQTGQQGEPQPGADFNQGNYDGSSAAHDDVVDAEFEEINDDDK